MSKMVLGRKKIIKSQWEDYRRAARKLKTLLFEHINDFVTECRVFIYR